MLLSFAKCYLKVESGSEVEEGMRGDNRESGVGREREVVGVQYTCSTLPRTAVKVQGKEQRLAQMSSSICLAHLDNSCQ